MDNVSVNPNSPSSVLDTSTKFTSNTTIRLTQAVFWTVFFSAIVLSIQSILPSLTYYRELATAEYSTSAQVNAWVWTMFSVRNVIRIIFLFVGTLIYFQKPHERISFLTSIFLLSFGSGGILYAQYVPNAFEYSAQNYLHLQLPLAFVGWLILFMYFIYFPDGRAVPRIAWLHIFPVVFIDFAFYLPEDTMWYAFNWHPVLLASVTLFALFVPLASQIYRYRNVSTPAQRQQTKWVVIGFALSIVSLLSAFAVFGNTCKPIDLIIMGTFGDCGFVMIPIMLAIAMLRYRLWDIDLIINRSLAYVVIAGLAALLFFVILYALQVFIGQSEPLVAFLVAISFTGFIFRPLHTRIQHFVDRYVYHFRFAVDELRVAHQQAQITNPGALSGQQLGDYQVLDVLGKGGMGEVYKATDGQHIVAIKTLLTNKTATDELVTRFQREGLIGQRLNHPNIAHVHHIAEHEGTLYMVMDYLEGQDLSDWLNEESKLDLQTVQEVMRDLASALDTAHESGLVHRDIKPSNIMMVLNEDNETHRAILMDFGVTKLQDAHTITGTGAIGTIDYMAPEQIIEARSVDRRADVYALGILVYEMLLGKRPFSGGVAQVMFAHIQQPAPDPRDEDEALPRHVAQAIMQALEKDPDDRFETVSDFYHALTQM